jgi:metal-sulfur cluster biosynthetic enzyme
VTAVETSAIEAGAITKALEAVVDPCSKAMGRPMDIVTMGLVESISIEDHKVTLTIILTDANCFFFGDIERFVADVLTDLPGVEEVDVQISSTTLWSPDRVGKSLPVLTESKSCGT